MGAGVAGKLDDFPRQLSIHLWGISQLATGDYEKVPYIQRKLKPATTTAKQEISATNLCRKWALNLTMCFFLKVSSETPFQPVLLCYGAPRLTLAVWGCYKRFQTINQEMRIPRQALFAPAAVVIGLVSYTISLNSILGSGWWNVNSLGRVYSSND